jgi:hypothetical protein
MQVVKHNVKLNETDRDTRPCTFALFDSGSEMAQFALDNRCARDSGRSGGWADVSGETACKNAINGNLDAAAASDRYLERFESFAVPAAKMQAVDSVVGMIPNVPAYLSGNPYNMRTRRKLQNESAPLAVIVDGTSSAGIGSDKIQKRGSAILAFCRAVSARRPLELWIAAGLGSYADRAGFYAIHKLETAPFDLARAAPCIASSAWARNVGYKVCNHHGSGGGWPFKGEPLNADQMARVMRHAFPHVADLLCIPAVFLTEDMLLSNPDKWLLDKIAEYSPQEDAA